MKIKKRRKCGNNIVYKQNKKYSNSIKKNISVQLKIKIICALFFQYRDEGEIFLICGISICNTGIKDNKFVPPNIWGVDEFSYVFNINII